MNSDKILYLYSIGLLNDFEDLYGGTVSIQRVWVETPSTRIFYEYPSFTNVCLLKPSTETFGRTTV